MDTAAEARNEVLLAWYRVHGRALPWRGVTDPYAVLVSEVMLQQTQAARVVARFPRFVDRFPTTRHLAAASLAEVMAEWSGLGYNSRARRLREAARVVEAEGWPTTVAGLRRLPGIGGYTAAAVACFAFGAGVPAVDTNLRRVLGRWLGTPLRGAGLEDAARRHLGAPARDWNQAMMDLGASVCTPRAPDCGACPVARWCAGPEAYEPPRPQARFEGSDRQVRGATLRALAGGGPVAVDEVAMRSGFPRHRVTRAAAALASDGMIVSDGEVLRLAD